MTMYSTEKAMQAVSAAKKAIVKRNTAQARRFAMLAVQNDPNLEDAWLVMAASASPHAAVEYLGKALEINPASDRAQKGMQWAVQRRIQFELEQVQTRVNLVETPKTIDVQETPIDALDTISNESASPKDSAQLEQPNEEEEISTELPGIVFPKISDHAYTLPRVSMLSWVMAVVLAGIGLIGFFILPPLLRGSAKNVSSTLPAGVYIKPTYTPTPTATFTPTATPTNTPTPTATPTATNTPYPTDTPLPPPTYIEEYYVYEPGELPNVKKKERWIDVDLSSQTVSAYEGQSNINTFVVSTGTWQHPTVTGKFHVYVKYRYTDMAGPGYYLPDVPYTMYFYDGYGLHGTYWHSNFGTPMSHGCINLRTEDAGWLYNWASVGTLVNVHE